MNSSQEIACKRIIHTHAAIAAAGNAVPLPGTGWAADVTTMTTMAMLLSGVFGSNLEKGVARNLAIASLKRQVLKQPIKQAAKALGKYIPFAGPLISASASAVMLEAAGWGMARELAALSAAQGAA